MEESNAPLPDLRPKLMDLEIDDALAEISFSDQPLAAWAGLWRPSDESVDCYTGVMVDVTT
jgi:hypothetical protein